MIPIQVSTIIVISMSYTMSRASPAKDMPNRLIDSRSGIDPFMLLKVLSLSPVQCAANLPPPANNDLDRTKARLCRIF